MGYGNTELRLSTSNKGGIILFGFIYITTNLINHKQYIGQRKIKGDDSDNQYLGSGKLITHSINKYGKENFTREILDYASSQEELDYLEGYYIELNHATTSPFFYNIAEGGKGGSKFAGWSEQQRLQFSKQCSERLAGKGNPRYGVKLTPEHRQLLSEIHSNLEFKKTWQSDEFRKKMSEVTQGEKNGMYGKTHSEESKKKISENRKGKTCGTLNGNYGNIGDKAKNGKPVFRYSDKERTIIIKRYNTATLALQDLGVVGGVGLSKAIKTGKMYKNSYWGR